MPVEILSGRLHRTEPLSTRMPFRYGIVTLTRLPHLFVRLDVRVDGAIHTGVAADHLPPKWFTKDPHRPVEDEIDEMLEVIGNALRLAAGQSGESVFALWRRLYDAQGAWGRERGLAPLLTHFGTSLVERALIDAFCRARGEPFARLLRENPAGLGVRLGEIHPPLAGHAPADLLPARPLDRITIRHTVGLADPLTENDVAPDERLDDGLPQSLDACIRAYGLRHFKIKLGGDAERDRERLGRIADLLETHAPADYAFSLDGNENFRRFADFRGFWDLVTGTARLRPFLHRLLFVEQPLHRDVALGPEVAEGFADWPERPPVLIDESDAELESFPSALVLGYAGTSHKNCKGVFKGIANACLAEQRRRTRPDEPCRLSGEDLSTIGPVSLLQDLAVQASLGIDSVERNGHHYFAGLSMFGPEVQREVLSAHPDLYHGSPAGWPTLTIQDGEARLGSVNAAPFGVGFPIDLSPYPAVSEER